MGSSRQLHFKQYLLAGSLLNVIVALFIGDNNLLVFNLLSHLSELYVSVGLEVLLAHLSNLKELGERVLINY